MSVVECPACCHASGSKNACLLRARAVPGRKLCWLAQIQQDAVRPDNRFVPILTVAALCWDTLSRFCRELGNMVLRTQKSDNGVFATFFRGISREMKPDAGLAVKYPGKTLYLQQVAIMGQNETYVLTKRVIMRHRTRGRNSCTKKML